MSSRANDKGINDRYQKIADWFLNIRRLDAEQISLDDALQFWGEWCVNIACNHLFFIFRDLLQK